ncbi:CcdB family protein [Enterobacter asburiae]|nr:CcdB family protein [Enterobacter asburiae]
MQYCVYKNRSGGNYPLLLDVQSNIIGELDRRMVIPLTEVDSFNGPMPTRLCFRMSIEGTEYIAVTADMASAPNSALGDMVADMGFYRQTIKESIDFLFDGF